MKAEISTTRPSRITLYKAVNQSLKEKHINSVGSILNSSNVSYASLAEKESYHVSTIKYRLEPLGTGVGMRAHGKIIFQIF